MSLGQDPPVVLEIEAVVRVYRKQCCALLGVAVTGHVPEHDVRQRNAAGIGDGQFRWVQCPWLHRFEALPELAKFEGQAADCRYCG